MKIIQINSVFGYGSTGKITKELAEKLIALGHECKVVYGRGKNSTDTDFALKFGSDTSILVHGFLSRITDRQGWYSSRATRKLIRYLDDYKPNIIHLHNIHGYYLNIKILFEYLKNKNIPIIWTLHDCWPYTGHCAYYDYVSCSRWTEGCFSCPSKGQYPKSIVCDSSKRNYKEKKKLFCGIENLTIVTPSQWLGTEVKKSFLSEYPVRVVNNEINRQIFAPTVGNFREKNQIEKITLLLGVASVWEPRKGLQDFIKLSEILDPGNFKIVLVGLSKKLIKSLPVNVYGIERTNSAEELAALYSTADYYLNLTYEDNYPTTNLEAIACGTKVITYNTGGSSESVLPDNGYVFPKGNVSEIANFLIVHQGRNDGLHNKIITDSSSYCDEMIEVYLDACRRKA